MKTMKRGLILILLMGSFFALKAQRPGGRPGGGPEVMLEREKQAVYEKIDDLTADQKLLLDGIYEEFTVTLKETFEENRGGDREAMRTKMQALRKEKDGLVADVLNEQQYQLYESVAKRRADRRGPPQDQ